MSGETIHLLDAKGVLTQYEQGGVYAIPAAEFTAAHALLLMNLESELNGPGVFTRARKERCRLLSDAVLVSMANCRAGWTDLRKNPKYAAALQECARRGVACVNSNHISNNPYEPGLSVVRAFWLSR